MYIACAAAFKFCLAVSTALRLGGRPVRLPGSARFSVLACTMSFSSWAAAVYCSTTSRVLLLASASSGRTMMITGAEVVDGTMPAYFARLEEWAGGWLAVPMEGLAVLVEASGLRKQASSHGRVVHRDHCWTMIEHHVRTERLVARILAARWLFGRKKRRYDDQDA